jgi:hypothetical protein
LSRIIYLPLTVDGVAWFDSILIVGLFAQDASLLLFFPVLQKTFKVGGCTCGVSLIDQPHLRQQKIGVCKLHGGQVLIHLRYIPTCAHTHGLQFHLAIFSLLNIRQKL